MRFLTPLLLLWALSNTAWGQCGPNGCPITDLGPPVYSRNVVGPLRSVTTQYSPGAVIVPTYQAAAVLPLPASPSVTPPAIAPAVRNPVGAYEAPPAPQPIGWTQNASGLWINQQTGASWVFQSGQWWVYDHRPIGWTPQTKGPF